MCSHHIETSQLICKVSQLTGFYMGEHWSLTGEDDVNYILVGIYLLKVNNRNTRTR